MARSTLSVAQIGIGGYGETYLSALFADSTHGARLVAAVDPMPTGSLLLAELHRRKIPVYRSMEEMQHRHAPMLTVICTPIYLHFDHVTAALKAGSHVLCEKPLCSTPAQAAEMIRVRDRVGKQVSIGYQWSFSKSIQALKRDIAAGLFGRPKQLRTLVSWPRYEAYYQRNRWAGRRYSKSALPVFDSPLNNACAHHLHNMFYVLGDTPDQSAIPSSVTAELYRANEIETFDTAAVRVWTTGGVELLIAVSHATRDEKGPCFTFEFEEATITFEGVQPNMQTTDGPPMHVQFANGDTMDYGSPEREPSRKLWAAVESARQNEPTVCGIEASLAQTLVTAAVHRSVPEAVEFPSKLIQTRVDNGLPMRWVEGLDEALVNCYASGKLPSESRVPWAVAGETIHLADLAVPRTDRTLKRGEILPLSAEKPQIA